MRFILQIVLVISILMLLSHVSCKSEGVESSANKTTKESPISSREALPENNINQETAWEDDIENVVKNQDSISEKIKEETAKIQEQPKKVIKKKPTKKKVKPKKQLSKIVFEEKEFDFGRITEGDTINHKFIFKNDSKIPLDIISADATCGCTRPSFPFIAIEQGEEGYIGVQYISINKEGYQKPEITVKSNGSSQPITLFLTGYVEPKPKKETAVKLDSLTPVILPNKG